MRARRPVATAVASLAVAAAVMVVPTAPAPAVPSAPQSRAVAADDTVPVRRPSHRLDVPPPQGLSALAPDGTAPGVRAWWRSAAPRFTAKHRYALSFVAIPIKGQRLGFSKSQVRAMTTRVARRMSQQTGGRISYGFASWTLAPKIRNRALTCDIYSLHARYRKYARYLRRTPRGYRDTIVVYATPSRYQCPFAGIAMLGGDATYLNGLYLRDRQRLQDWITAHELGHNLGLDHSASFWPSADPWSPGQKVPVNQRAQDFAAYGDYLDLMGQPPRGGLSLPGADFGRWPLNSLSLHLLGVLDDGNVTYVRRSGTFALNRLRPSRLGGAMTLAIPVVADGERTYWALEFRPATENSGGVRYPEPFATRGYGVRLLLVRHGGALSLNKVFHWASNQSARAVLPPGVAVRLGGGATVTVVGLDANRALVKVAVAG